MLFTTLASPILVTLFTIFMALMAPPGLEKTEALLEFFRDPLSANWLATPTAATNIAATKTGLTYYITPAPMADELGLFQTKQSQPRPNTPMAITLFDFEAPEPITNYEPMPSILNLATIAKTQAPNGITSPTATSSSMTGAAELQTQLWTGKDKPMVVAANAPTESARAGAEREFWSIAAMSKLLQLVFWQLMAWFSVSKVNRTTILTTLMHFKVYGPPLTYKAEASRRRKKIIMRIDQPRK
ncbi:hypothetical protein JA9_003601 [Meyerozyma sp. JA9]|nr:hypothetical protein JA9_003601 [Meyerozyma sp. JA9]